MSRQVKRTACITRGYPVPYTGRRASCRGCGVCNPGPHRFEKRFTVRAVRRHARAEIRAELNTWRDDVDDMYDYLDAIDMHDCDEYDCPVCRGDGRYALSGGYIMYTALRNATVTESP